jgi:hypothetical protein
MRPPAVLISLLIVASVLVDLAALDFAGHHPGAPAAKAFLASLAFSQVAMVAIWAGLGRAWVFLRLTAALGACWLLSQMFGAGEPELRGAWSIVLVAVSSPIVAGLWAWRANGLRLATSVTSAAAAEPRPAGWSQFRIADFLGATFVVGVLLAMVRQITETDPDGPLRPLFIAVVVAQPLIVVGIAMSACATLLAWLILRRNEPYSRLMALAASLVVGGALGFISIRSEADPLLGSGTLVVLMTTSLLIGSLVVLRIAGYRLATAPAARRSAADRNASSAMAAS